MMAGCAAQSHRFSARPEPLPSSRIRPDSSSALNEASFQGPTLTFKRISLQQLVTLMDRKLLEEGFRRLRASRHTITYQLDQTGHPEVKKVRLTLRFIRENKTIYVNTRVKAQVPMLSLKEEGFVDVSTSKPAVKRIRRLYKFVKTELNQSST